MANFKNAGSWRTPSIVNVSDLADVVLPPEWRNAFDDQCTWRQVDVIVRVMRTATEGFILHYVYRCDHCNKYRAMSDPMASGRIDRTSCYTIEFTSDLSISEGEIVIGSDAVVSQLSRAQEKPA